MTLGYSTHWPKNMGGKLTLFPEKILESLNDIYDFRYHDYHDGELPLGINKNDDVPEVESIEPKKHTIRMDSKNRWREGNLIHSVINNRTANRYQFAPTIKCTGVQKIEIRHFSDHVEFSIDDKFFGSVFHHGIDMVYEYTNCVRELAINDGFDSIEHFLQWFDKDFTGKIIHWTDLKY
jgi:hypothetical protein